MRIRWVDIAKGIGIILVVAGHTRANGLLNGAIGKWIVSFHMPLFFLIAGFCFDANRYKVFGGVNGYFLRKVRVLCYPYVTLSLLMAVLSVVLYWGDDPTQTMMYQVRDLAGGGSSISPFWFIRILLVVELCYWWVAHWCASRGIRLATALCVATVAAYLPLDFSSHLMDLCPLRKIAYAFLFYCFGDVLRTALDVVLNAWRNLGITALLFVLHFFALAFFYPYVTFFAARGDGIPMIRLMISLVGIGAVLYAAKSIDVLMPRLGNVLEWFGRNSIILLAVHGHCGIFRKTWTWFSGWQTTVLEVLLIAFLMWSLSSWAHYMVVCPKFQKKEIEKSLS